METNIDEDTKQSLTPTLLRTLLPVLQRTTFMKSRVAKLSRVFPHYGATFLAVIIQISEE